MSSITLIIYTAITTINSFFSSGSNSASGKLDLFVNGQNDPAGIVVIKDLKPGDNREVEKDLRVKCVNSAKVYLHLKDVSSSQGLQTEPEVTEENGTPKFDLENHVFYHLRFGSNVIISPSDRVRFSDIISCWIPVGTLLNNKHYKLYQGFHLPPTVTNWAQGDETSFTEEFIAVEANQPAPITPSGRVWNPALKKCVPGPTPTPSPTPTPKPSPTLKPTSTPRPTRTPTPTKTPRNWLF